MVLSFFLTAGLCTFLYLKDNRYHDQGDQPICGTFVYEGEDPDEICWLYREWEFFPGVSVEADGSLPVLEGAYRRYTDLGGTDPMEHGSAVYRMTLILPEQEDSYALEIPEIYSASIVYRNGKAVMQTGNPSPGQYEAKTATRVVYFEGGGRQEIVIAVRDENWIYSGMTHVPAFGRAETVIRMHDLRLFLHGMGIVLSAAGLLMAGVFCLRSSPKRGKWYMAAFASLEILTGYPVFHGLGPASLQPWYTLEVTAYYVLILSVLVLILSFFPAERTVRLYVLVPCAAGVFSAFLRSAGAAYWSSEAGNIFSGAVFGLKVYAALCLLIFAFVSDYERKGRMILVLFSASAFSCCLAADRILPLYEPIYGGWFEEMGGCILGILAAGFMWLDAVEAYRFRLTYEEHYRNMEQKLAIQKKHYRELSGQVKRSRAASHDMRHHVRVLRTFAENGQLDKVRSYLAEYEPHLEDSQVLVWSDHPAADAVLSYYRTWADQIGALYDVNLAVPEDLDFPEDELCVILSNLLENAVHALEKEPLQGRRIFLRGKYQESRLLLAVDNTFSGTLKMSGGEYLSASHEGVGTGIESVKMLVKKHGGLADFSAEGGMFRVSIMLPAGEKRAAAGTSITKDLTFG